MAIIIAQKSLVTLIYVEVNTITNDIIAWLTLSHSHGMCKKMKKKDMLFLSILWPNSQLDKDHLSKH